MLYVLTFIGDNWHIWLIMLLCSYGFFMHTAGFFKKLWGNTMFQTQDDETYGNSARRSVELGKQLAREMQWTLPLALARVVNRASSILLVVAIVVNLVT